MGIVLKQSSINTVIIFTAFAIGGINTLFLYTNFLTPEHYGLVVFLLSAANLLMPLTAFGVQYTIVKFYTSYQNKEDRDRFLLSALILPVFIAIPIGFLWTALYQEIGDFLSIKNGLIKDYTFIIYLVALATAYFEIFYSWAKVQMQSVFGNAVRELYSRISTMILLLLIWFRIINTQQFIWLMTASYFLRMIIMMWYAFRLYRPKLLFQLPYNFKEILRYSIYIILAGSAGAIMIDIDKVMLPRKEAIELAAYYTVGVFIASVIDAPGRAMNQIVQPLTSKALQENNMSEVASLYKRSSINLLLVCGLIFLLINLNVIELYKILPDGDYSKGVFVVLMISISKLYTMSMGNNGAIISNSKHYKILLPYGIAMALSVTYLNEWLITIFSMNGAALSTLLVILFFNSLKIWYVNSKFNLVPFSYKTFLLVVIIASFYGVFSFWDFPFYPIVNIILKSILIVITYLFVVIKLKISSEINAILNKFL